MSVGRCGICAAPTLTGAICATHWDELTRVLVSCMGLGGDLDAAARKQLRVGERERVTGTATPGLPVNLDAVEARRALVACLSDAVRAVLGPFPALQFEDAVRLLNAHAERLRGSWAAPVLLVELGAAVRQARAVLQPRGRVSVSVPCPACGAVPLRPVGGALECAGCGVRSSIGEVRRAC